MSSEINSSDNENKTNLNEDIRENENTNDGSFNAKESGKSEDEMINEALNDAANADVSDESNDVESTGNTDNAENSDTGETTGSDEFHEKTEDEKIDEELKAAENIENVDETPSSQNDLNEDPDQLNAEPEDKSPFAPDANQNDSNIDGSLANDSETQAVADESVVNSENPEKSESEENEGVSAAAAEISDELTQEENAENSESGEGAETSNAVPEISAETNPENDTDASNETSETTDNSESEHNPDEVTDNSEISYGFASNPNTDESDESNDVESTGNLDNSENSDTGKTAGSGEFHEKTEDEKIDEELKAAENIDESNIYSGISDGSASGGNIAESNDETGTINTVAESNADVSINTETDNHDRTERIVNNVSLESQVDEQNIKTEVNSAFSNNENDNYVENTNTKSFYFENASYQQGENDIGALGTCGPTSIANALNLVTNSSNYSENSVLHDAIDNNLCVIDQNPFITGGTSTLNVVSLIDLEKGPESDIKCELYEFSNALDINTLAERLEDKNTIAIVGVSSSILWDRENNVGQSGIFQQQYSDHWITVESPVYNSNGDLEGFNIIDSGGGVDYVTAEKFETMYSNQVLDPTAILISNSKNTNIITEKETGMPTLIGKYKESALDSDGGSPPELSSFESHLSEFDKIGYEQFTDRTKDILDKNERETAFSELLNRDFENFVKHFDFSSPNNGAVLWSGEGYKNIAREYAMSNGGKTLEMTEGGKVLDEWKWLNEKYNTWGDNSKTDLTQLWKSASYYYSSQTHGVVTYVHSHNYEGYIYNSVEKPEIKSRIRSGYVSEIRDVYSYEK